MYGDYRYDIAKILHSFHGNYDLIKSSAFSLLVNDHGIDFKLFAGEYQNRVRQLLTMWIFSSYGEISQQVFLIEALLFLSMVSLHSDQPDQQVIMLAMGVELLERALEKLEIKDEYNNNDGRRGSEI